MSKFCPNCQKQFDDTINFCLECGKPLIDENEMKEEIINCSFQFQCPLDWNKLQLTENEDVRFCSNCKRNVYFVHTQYDLNNFARAGQCVAFNSKNKLFFDGKVQYEPPLMGMIIPPERFKEGENPFDLAKTADENPDKKSWWKFWK